jgi:thiamine biosynthesis lipoprotein
LAGCQETPSESGISGEAQGTTYHIKLVLDATQATLTDVQSQVTSMLDDIDAKLSNYREDSEISRINQQETSDWISVSPEIAELLSIAHTVYERSNGCYDLTVKPIFDLWGFSRHEGRVPTQDEIDAVLAHVGMPLLELDTANLRLRKKDPKLKIDLSSIAQGYGVGLVARKIESLGVHDYLVEIGGEMIVKGRKKSWPYHWQVAIEKPNPFTREVQKVVEVREVQGTAIMTAGTYRNFFEDQGRSYSHIINPKTGRPVTHHLVSVTVMHDDPTWADAWDTALLCVGEQEAARIADAESLKVLLIYKGSDRFEEHLSKAFRATQ